MHRDGNGPTPAERARTTLADAPTLTVEFGDVAEVVAVRAVDTDGSLIALVATDGTLAARADGTGLPCTVHGGRPIPLACPDRTLDVVTLFGAATLVDADDLGAALGVMAEAYPGRCADLLLRPDASALVRIHVTQVRIDGAPVDPDAYRGARPDPLAAGSDGVVSHLAHDHPDHVMALAHLLDPALVRAARMLAPVRVDRHGLVFRVLTVSGTAYTRLDFPAALRGPEELPGAMRALESRAAQVTTCPFSGEPRRAG